jgi:hypothetical protein
MIESFQTIEEDEKKSRKHFNQLGIILVAISSLLLGIWATIDTIALRNMLLALGSALSLIYIMLEFRQQNLVSQLTWKNCLPLILIGLMFAWVVFHYFFLGRYPEQQFDELRSTWLRSFLAVILALGTGFAISRAPKLINLLWLGILGSFLVLFYQYIPIAIAKNSLFASDYYGQSYIYLAKINGVLMGTILIAGLTGTLIDTARRGNSSAILLTSIYWLFGVFLVIYSYVHIFMTRNGIGLATLLFIFWLVIGIPVFVRDGLKKEAVRIPKFLFSLIFVLVAAFLFSWLGLQHIKKSAPDWLSLFDDASIAVQIEKYPNWRDPETLGYPKKLDGTTVVINTYERVAWATAGTTLLLPENPLGLGILNRPYPRLLLEKYGKDVDYIPSTHSAWIEFGLAFGYPGMFLLLGTLSILIARSFREQFIFRATCLSISTFLLLMYAVGELSTAHAVEILFYWIAFLIAIQVKCTIK